jgi:SAM-dependent methyltransferase
VRGGRSATLLALPPNASQIAHAGLPFANPMSEAAVDASLRALPLPAGARLLDTGCGSGETLLRALAVDPTWSGLGVDLDEYAVAEARRRAGGSPAHFEVLDAGDVSGHFDAVLNVASSHVHGGFPAALEALGGLADVVLYGEGYWRQPPSVEFLDALGGATADELPDLDGLRSAVADAGFKALHEELAGPDDWERYESSLVANAERHGGSDSVAYARRIRERRALPGGVDTLGFALFVLRRTGR